MAEVDSSGDAGSGTTEKVIKQIEYYFGDINLMRDRFLKEKVQEDDGWVTIETMLKFNRLRALTEDPNVICEALKKSSSGLMEVHENGEKIRRNPAKPLPGDTKERREELMARSVYAKGFPLEIKLDDLQEFFETYGPVETIFMKRDFHKKTFKGSVFVTFSKKEDADKFMKEEGTKYKDQALELKFYKADYFKHKLTEKKGKGKKENKSEDKSKEEIKKGEKKETPEDEEERVKQQMTKNAVLYLSGMNPETSREDVKKFFKAYGDVGWIDFDKGVTEGYLRLREPNSAAQTMEKAKAANDGKIVLHDTEVEVRVVEGDEELQYWKKMFRDIADKYDKNKKGGRKDRRQGGRNQRGGRRNRGGPQGKKRQNKRKDDNEDENGDSDGGEDDSEEPPVKVQKTEAD